MTDFEFKEDTTNQQSNYPTESDNSFTLDEQEAIKTYKENLARKLNKNRSVLRGLEMSFWGITSYSLARFLILTSGMDGVPLAVSAILIINQITNREAIEELINRKGEESQDKMGRLIKFGFSTLVTAFLIWSALGNFLSVIRTSSDTYKNLQVAVDDFNKLPDDKQNAILIVGGLIGLAGIYVIIDSRRR
ncbi:hypothetical protein NIES4071_108460 (plasmid) [Calothrix sp. NIES-4071]|nr:hypothetical protein NIES4071_108460 [Calothrix sp. NIES-4071]BAZ65142.1 hypothetical protein NIES4105_108750 [Calothrix sp. NIES-4105]